MPVDARSIRKADRVSNEAQIQYWNEEAGPKWVQLEDRLDAQIGPIGDAMLDLAAPSPGERVIVSDATA